MDNKNNKPIEFNAREIQIIQLAAQGYSNNEISKILNFSYHTVRADIRRIIEKSGAKNRINAVYILTVKGYVKYSLINQDCEN